MSPLPNYRPRKTSLGPLEREVLEIVWGLGSASVKEVREQILQDPNRELAYTSVTTVLRRLTKKGWLTCNREEKAFCWQPRVSRQEAEVIQAHEQLNRFLEVGNPDVVAAFADSLDKASVEQISAIAQRIQKARQARNNEELGNG